MQFSQNPAFWFALDRLVQTSQIVIDRPKGSAHPRYPDMIYPVDYGYLQGTASMDGEGIDVWRGTDPAQRVDAVVCTVDLLKQDSEIKILIGCTEEEKVLVCETHNDSEYMKGLLIRRPDATGSRGELGTVPAVLPVLPDENEFAAASSAAAAVSDAAVSAEAALPAETSAQTAPTETPFAAAAQVPAWHIRPAGPADLPALAALGCQLWPDHTPAELEEDFAEELNAGAQFFLAALPAGDDGEDARTAGRYIGFAQCSLRRDYVEGTHSSPVGYLEGIYVAPEVRRQGAAKALLACAEQWAREQGCTEFASDCELTNTTSQAFHRLLGFTEANRIVCYTKSL